MRLASLLFAGLVLLVASCRTGKLSSRLKQHPFDTLARYSYLLVTWGRDSLGGPLEPKENGTGVFYRRGERLYLITVYHGLTGCPMYKDTAKSELDSVDIWFSIGARRYCKRLSLAAHKFDTCKKAWEAADVDTLDVTNDFRGIKVNSIEHWISDSCNDPGVLSRDDTLICFGFSNVPKWQGAYGRHSLPKKPKGYVCWGADSAVVDDRPGMRRFYYYVGPNLNEGDSGGPMFRVRPDGAGGSLIEFMGIQAAVAITGYVNYSTVVKKKEIMKKLFYSK